MNQIKHSQKSPFSRLHASARGRGFWLTATVAVLLAGAAIWIVSFTRAVELEPLGGPQTVDPGAASGGSALPAR